MEAYNARSIGIGQIKVLTLDVKDSEWDPTSLSLYWGENVHE